METNRAGPYAAWGILRTNQGDTDMRVALVQEHAGDGDDVYRLLY
jgi:hypothetical protein